jgi:hypothetical protein
MRIDAMEDLAGSALLFWNPSTVMMARSTAAGGGEHLQLAFEVIWIIRHPQEILGIECVCTSAVVDIDRDCTFFSHLDGGLNVSDP